MSYSQLKVCESKEICGAYLELNKDVYKHTSLNDSIIYLSRRMKIKFYFIYTFRPDTSIK